MRRTLSLMAGLLLTMSIHAQRFPQVVESAIDNYFPMATPTTTATICTGADDHAVVSIAAGLLADDIGRVTGRKATVQTHDHWRQLPHTATIVAGTLGHSRLVDELTAKLKVDVASLRGQWESYLIVPTRHPRHKQPLLLVVGSDRRGTAFALTHLSEAIGVSPWYWWADVTPTHKRSLYVEPIAYRQGEPSVQYRGIFINDERFGGWARWAEQTYDKESGKVGPKTYRQVFELLLRLRANYLWPAMHPGTAAFNADPENARLADDYAIVMGSSHCEQMLSNNEGEWKAVGTYGDFNYITNRTTMQRYWEERVETNGAYENTYTLGLRGIHDYPMEGANSTQERVALMQQAIDDQRAMLRRHIDRPIEEIPQVLCTYEEVLDAYHNGLRVPDDVTLLWSDDKHGYCRNLSNPEEQQRPGGAGIYYHLSYHGDPASWIWLSPLSPAFLSTELTKAYTHGARKIWVFNVGDIKPAEKEISFVIDLAWDIDRWRPEQAHLYIRHWAAKTFGSEVADEIADLQAQYYRLQAGGKDAHVWFVEYSEAQIAQRIAQWRDLSSRAKALEARVATPLRNAYFELVSYPICGAAMANEYQLLARRSMVLACSGDSIEAMADANRVKETFDALNTWTRHYNDELLDGKWSQFFNWQPYHWFRSEHIDPPISTPEAIAQSKHGPKARFIDVDDALSDKGAPIFSEVSGEIPIWMKALSPIRNFSKAAADNVFCHVDMGDDHFDASATPINNVWHAPYVGPMWSRVGTLHLQRGSQSLHITGLKADARLDRIFIGLWPPFNAEPRLRLPASAYSAKHDAAQGRLTTVSGLGYSDGVVVLPFDTPSHDTATAPYVEYTLDISPDDHSVEVRTLPTLHVYEGRDARFAVQLGDNAPEVFSIHADDFTAEWRLNVLRGYATRSIAIPAGCSGRQQLRIYLLDPGIVVQEVLVN